MERQTIQSVEKIWKEKYKTGRLMLLDFRTYHNATVARQCGTDERTEHWNRIKSTERDPHKCSQLITDKGKKTMQWSKDGPFNKECWTNWTFTRKKKNLYTHIHVSYVQLLSHTQK